MDRKVTASMTWREVSALRLERHGLAAPVESAALAEIAGAICGAHAQVMSAAEISLGLRVSGITRADVRAALWSQHRLIKTYGPRGTVHVLAAKDLPIWTGALNAVPESSAAKALLAPEQTEAVVEAIAGALDAAEMTVDELDEAVVAAAGAWAGDLVMPAFGGWWPRWRKAITTAAHRGVLCFGPERGRKVTYTNPRRWLPDFQPEGTETALADAVARYLYAYGPATPQQFAQWLSAPKRWASDLFESLSDRLRPVMLEGETAWLNADDEAETSNAGGLRLLPYFDPYTVGGHPREKLFPGRAAERALHNGQAGTVPVVLIDGIVSGVWHQQRSGQKIAVRVESFVDLTAAQRDALDAQIARLGEILEGKPTLTMGKVEAGKHL